MSPPHCPKRTPQWESLTLLTVTQESWHLHEQSYLCPQQAFAGEMQSYTHSTGGRACTQPLNWTWVLSSSAPRGCVLQLVAKPLCTLQEDPLLCWRDGRSTAP